MMMMWKTSPNLKLFSLPTRGYNPSIIQPAFQTSSSSTSVWTKWFHSYPSFGNVNTLQRKDDKYGVYMIYEDGVSNLPTREIAKQIIHGGIKYVQIREKKKSSKAFLHEAKEMKALLGNSGVKIIINDRVDVALACDADGVHLGQDDLDISEARRILGPNKILGCTVNNPSQAHFALLHGADYLGTDAVFPTETKPDSKAIGLQQLKRICDSTSLPVVAIGGVDEITAEMCIKAGASGLASCSGLLNPVKNGGSISKSALALRSIFDRYQTHYSTNLAKITMEIVEEVRKANPLILHVTNNVTINDVANVTIACGASPVMAHENQQMVSIAHAVVLNMGTLDDSQLEAMICIAKEANSRKIPVIFDAVGAGATSYRTDSANKLLQEVHVDVLRGNSSEIAALAGCRSSTTRGVDAVDITDDKYQILRSLTCDNRVVVMTGKHDIICYKPLHPHHHHPQYVGSDDDSDSHHHDDGYVFFEVHNNSAWLQSISGTGCMLTALIGAFVAASGSRHGTALACTSATAFFSTIAEFVQFYYPLGGLTFRSLLIDSIASVNSSILTPHIKIMQQKRIMNT